MAVFVLLYNDQGQIVDVQRREQDTFHQTITTGGGAYGFGTTFGVSLEAQRIQLSQLIRQSAALTEPEKDALIRTVLTTYTVHDTYRFTNVTAADLSPAQQIRFGIFADQGAQPKPLFIVIRDP